MIATSSGVVSFSCPTSEDHAEWVAALEKTISYLENNFFSFDSTEDEYVRTLIERKTIKLTIILL